MQCDYASGAPDEGEGGSLGKLLDVAVEGEGVGDAEGTEDDDGGTREEEVTEETDGGQAGHEVREDMRDRITCATRLAV
jgi:hypothetical protein